MRYKSILLLAMAFGVALLGACAKPSADSGAFTEKVNEITGKTSADEEIKIERPTKENSKYYTNPMSFVFFDDGNATVRLSKEIYNYCKEHDAPIEFRDSDGNKIMMAYMRPDCLFFDILFDGEDFNFEPFGLISRMGDIKEEDSYVIFSFDAVDKEDQTPTRYPSEEMLRHIQKYSYGDGTDYDFSMDFVDYINRAENKVALIPDSLKDLLFKTEDDNAVLMPTTDDYKIEFYDIPMLKKITGYTAGYDAHGSAIYYGYTDDKDANLYMTCQFVKVTCYDEHGDISYVGERLDFSGVEDSFYTAAAGNVILYFENYNGVDAIPSNYNSEELITYINDVLLVNSMGGSFISNNFKRVDSSYYYYENLENDPGKRIVGLNDMFDLELSGSSSANLATGSDVVTHSSSYITYYSYANETVRKMFSCDKSYYYSIPGNHVAKYAKGTGASFNGSYPAEAINMGYVPYGKDSEYFSPATDDYILIFEKEASGDSNYFSVLRAFDQNGKLIQKIERSFQSLLYKEDQDRENQERVDAGAVLLYSDDTYAYFDTLGMEDPKNFTKIAALSNMVGPDETSTIVVGSGTNEYYRAYISMPTLTGESSSFANDFEPESNFLKIEGLSVSSKDYYMTREKNQVAYGTTNGKTWNVEYPVDRYHVTFFDESGLWDGSDDLEVLVFTSEADAKAYYNNLKEYGSKADFHISGNKVSISSEGYDINKYTVIASGSSTRSTELEYALSVPHLTDLQAQYFENNGYKLK